MNQITIGDSQVTRRAVGRRGQRVEAAPAPDASTPDAPAPTPATPAFVLPEDWLPTNWIHEDHPADVIVHSFGPTWREMIEGAVTGCTGVIMEDLELIDGGVLTRREVEGGGCVLKEYEGERFWYLDENDETTKMEYTDEFDTPIVFDFSAPNLSTLVYQILQNGVLSLYGTFDYFLCKRGEILSLECTHGDKTIDVRSMKLTDYKSVDDIEFKPEEIDQWGFGETLFDSDGNQCLFKCRMTFWGESYSSSKHTPGCEVKAITRHNQHVGFNWMWSEKENDETDLNWHSYILVDI